MSDDNSSPIGSLFEAQRQLIENGQQFFETTMQIPLEMNAALREALDEQRKLQQETLEQTRDAVTQVLDTVEEAGPGENLDDVQRAVDDGFETLLDQHEAVYESADENYEEALEQLEETIEALTEQVETVLELNEQLESQVGGVTGDYDDLATTLESQFQGFDETITSSEDASGVEHVEHQREQIESVRERIESLRTNLEETVEQAESDGEDADSATEAADPEESADDQTGSDESTA